MTEDQFGENMYCMWDNGFIEAIKEDTKNGSKIKTVLTHEQYEQNCFRLEK